MDPQLSPGLSTLITVSTNYMSTLVEGPAMEIALEVILTTQSGLC